MKLKFPANLKVVAVILKIFIVALLFVCTYEWDIDADFLGKVAGGDF